MLNFELYNPVRLYFGKNSLNNLSVELTKYGRNILLVTGSSSIKKSGLYGKIVSILKQNKKNIFELNEIQSNPDITKVYEGIKISKKNKIDFILGAGGGSVIDTVKTIAAGAITDKDVWDFFLKKANFIEALPFGAIMTLAASGSEMNASAVISNRQTSDKLAIWNPAIYPKFSILDPEYTFSVPLKHTAYGCIDIISHVFEQYFTKTASSPLQDRFCEAIIKTVIENTYKIMEKPDDYDTRANIMICGTMALNGPVSAGRESDWATHAIEHELSALYDIPHGAGLSILHPNWMIYVMNERIEIFKQYATRVWGLNSGTECMTDENLAMEGIKKTKEFFKNIGAPVTLKEAGIDDKHLVLMAEKAVRFGPIGNFKKLEKKDVLAILKASLE